MIRTEVLITSLGILFIISSLLSLHPKNNYSLYTKILKFFPRLILGISLMLSSFCLCDTTVGIILGFSFVFMLSEVVVQYMNIRYGRK